MKKFFAILLAAMMMLSLVPAMAEQVEATEEGEFPEYPIGPAGVEDNEQEVGFMSISVVYFQPVDMAPAGKSLAKEDATCHVEADITANENPYGFGVGDWVPYLTINYVIKDKDGNIIADGAFMPMAASDGPHYGANIAIPDGEGYSMTLSILSPAENGYLLHIDKETGVAGNFEVDWVEPLEVTWTDWDFVNLWK